MTDDYVPGTSRTEWLARHDARYRRLWGEQTPRGACAHLGQETGETRECPSCRGRVLLKLRACAVHGRCTTHRPVEGAACCLTCLDHAAVLPRDPGEADPPEERAALL